MIGIYKYPMNPRSCCSSWFAENNTSMPSLPSHHAQENKMRDSAMQDMYKQTPVTHPQKVTLNSNSHRSVGQNGPCDSQNSVQYR
jgi:hypothetical protein